MGNEFAQKGNLKKKSHLCQVFWFSTILLLPRLSLLIEQGHETGRDGRVLVEAERGETVSIEGTAVYERNGRWNWQATFRKSCRD